MCSNPRNLTAEQMKAIDEIEASLTQAFREVRAKFDSVGLRREKSGFIPPPKCRLTCLHYIYEDMMAAHIGPVGSALRGSLEPHSRNHPQVQLSEPDAFIITRARVAGPHSSVLDQVLRRAS